VTGISLLRTVLLKLQKYFFQSFWKGDNLHYTTHLVVMIMTIQWIVIQQQQRLIFRFVGIFIIWNHIRDIKWYVNILFFRDLLKIFMNKKIEQCD
jgi:hypothetical protein